MTRLNIFDDNRRIPKLSVNIKVRCKDTTLDESAAWNYVFGYIMKKPRTKLDFLAVGPIRTLNLSDLKLSDLQGVMSDEDYTELLKIETLFNDKLSVDVKAFILAMLKVSYQDVQRALNVA